MDGRSPCAAQRLSRRGFVGVLAVGALAGAATARAQAGAHVAETDEQALALGYKEDSAKVDAAKFPKHSASQRCHSCSFWQGSPKDEWAGCAMFGRKQIAAGGWCQAWTKAPG